MEMPLAPYMDARMCGGICGSRGATGCSSSTGDTSTRAACYVVAVGVPPPLDTDTSEGGRSAHVGSTSSDVLPQVQLPAASYTTASTGPYMSGARPDSGVFASRC